MHRIDQLLRGGHSCGERRAHFASIRNAVTVNIICVVEAFAGVGGVADAVTVIVTIAVARRILVGSHIDLTIENAVVAVDVERQAGVVGGCVIALIDCRASRCEVVVAVGGRCQGSVNRCGENRVRIAQSKIAAIIVDRTGTSDASDAALNAAVAHIQCAIDLHLEFRGTHIAPEKAVDHGAMSAAARAQAT